MEFAELIKVIVLLAVVGFVIWMIEQAPISAMFKHAIRFIAILVVALYVLKLFAVL